MNIIKAIGKICDKKIMTGCKEKVLRDLSQLLIYADDDEEIIRCVWGIIEHAWLDLIKECSTEDKSFFKNKMEHAVLRLLCLETLLNRLINDEMTDLCAYIQPFEKSITNLLNKHRKN